MPLRRVLLLPAWLAVFGLALATTAPKSARLWKVEDFDAILFVGLEGNRDFEQGRALFLKAGCGACHGQKEAPARLEPEFARAVAQQGPRGLLEIVLAEGQGLARPRELGGDREADALRQLGDAGEDEILDLLAYLLSGGRKDAPWFAH